MLDLLKPLLMVLVLELAAFAVIRRLLAPMLELQAFDRRRNVWLTLTAAQFLSPNIWTFAAIAHTLGVPLGTVEAWTAGRRRNRAPVRVIVQRVKGPSDAEAARVIVQRVKAPPSTSSGFSVP